MSVIEIPPRPRFQASVETQKIIERLLSSHGETVTYSELYDLTGLNVQHEGRGNLATATKRLQKDHGLVFLVERKVGVYLANDVQITEAAHAGIVKTRRATGREIAKLGCADFSKLSTEKKAEHLTYASQLGAMHLMSKPSSAKKIAGKVSQTQEKIDISDTLALFGGGADKDEKPT